MSKQTEEVTYHTITQAAAATGLPRNVITDAKKRAPQLILTPGGRLRLRGLCQWLRQRHPAPKEDNLERLRRVKADREAFRLAKDRGEHYDAEAVESAVTRTIASMQRELERRLLAVVPGEGAHLNARDLRNVLQQHLSAWADFCQRKGETLEADIKP